VSHSHRWLRCALALAGMTLGIAVAPAAPGIAAPAPASSVAAYDASGKGKPVTLDGNRSGMQGRALAAQNAPTPECPPVLMSKCSFEAAYYGQNNPADFTDYSNYDLANRPADGTQIKGVTVHDIEGSCEAAVDHFKDPNSFVSAHYVICADGRVIQMVELKNIAWTAGNWWYNSHFIQVEHAGYASSPTGYTPQMYASSVLLVQWLSQKYGFPLDKAHVHGHDNVPATRTSGIASMHVDPGPFWAWQNYLAALRLRSPVDISGNPFTSSMVVVAPVWPFSKQVVTGCNVSNDVPPPCVPAGGPYATNFVYLRNEPNQNASFITDPVTGPGSTEIENRSARAFYGSKWKVADRQIDNQGIWYKIWFGGQAAWFYSPFAAPTAFPASGKCATPKGTASVAVYGRPLPELSEWPTNFTPPPGSQPAPTALLYSIPAGQCYAVIEDNMVPDHFFTWSFGNELPRVRVVGKTLYVWVEFNGRHAFVKRSDVAVV
jgi:N-acetyl-anhydromuramyl-L-alanine amidase AmpD